MPPKEIPITHQKRVYNQRKPLFLLNTYTILEAVVHDHTAAVGHADQLLPHDLQALGHTRLTLQQVQEPPVCRLPQPEETVASARHEVTPRSGLDLVKTLVPSLLCFEGKDKV